MARDELLREFDRLGMAAHKDTDKNGGGLRVVQWGQGFRDMAGAINALEVAIMERKLVHANVPILSWSVGNAVATTGPAGNRKLDKEKARFRIDGAVALAMGLRARDRGSAYAIDVRALIG